MHTDQNKYEESYFTKKIINAPIIIWWTPFTLDLGSYTKCGETKKACYVTNVRKYRDHNNTKAFLYYGSDFYLHDLPLPRRPHEEWGLLHEESPKNNFLFSFERIMKMFNHTSTFKRESDSVFIFQSFFFSFPLNLENKFFLAFNYSIFDEY